jgi:diaminopimelate decarboxylase
MTMDISWELLNNIEGEYGDSFYLLDLESFKNNYYEFLEAFRYIYPNTNIAYSYKTNYIPRLCQSINSFGGYAEVVSRMEYDLAMRIGVPPERIIYNGPYKCESDIKEALLSGAVVNIDGPYEVDIVEGIARGAPDHPLLVGLRCNFDVGTDHDSRFGFDIHGNQFRATLETLNGIDNCVVAGLHCHFLPPNRSVEAYAAIAIRMIELSRDHFADIYPRFIDLGGGFFSKMSPDLRQQFPCHVPNFREYAEAIGSQFADAFPDDSGPMLILEPGIAITADVMKFVAKVIDIKKVGSKTVSLVSGSVYNIKPTLNDRNLPLLVVGNNANSEVRKEPIDLVGYTCMEGDCLYRAYEGPLSVGDYVVFSNVGAYTVVLKPPFIHPCPVILAYDSDSKRLSVIKRQETLSDVFSTYEF